MPNVIEDATLSSSNRQQCAGVILVSKFYNQSAWRKDVRIPKLRSYQPSTFVAGDTALGPPDRAWKTDMPLQSRPTEACFPQLQLCGYTRLLPFRTVDSLSTSIIRRLD